MTTASLSSSNAPGPIQRHIRLLSACVSDHEARVREVLSEEPWSSPADRDALRQALVKVATKGSLKLLRLLLEHGADVHPRRENELAPLFKAAEAGHLPVVAELLAHGADPNWRGRNGQTALFPACVRGHDAVVRALLDGGADPDGGRNEKGKPGDKDGKTPLLFLASEKRGRWSVKTVRLLLQRDIDMDPKDSLGRTPLHWTAKNGYLDFASALLSGEFGKRADVNAPQNRGKTALHLAAEHNQVDFVELLLGHGACPDAASDGRWTPLHNASEKGHHVIVKKLLAAGANVNAELSNRMTPLHWAAFNGHEEVVRLLLERPETNLSVKDQFERTALLCAAERYHKELVHLLSPARAADRLSEEAREASKQFRATVVDFGDFQERKFLKGDVREKKKQLVFKPTVYELLYGWEDTEKKKPKVPILTKNVKWEPHFRWIHLPANNIAWVETLLAKSFVEGGFRDVEGFKALEKSFDQEHRGAFAHDTFMRSHCRRVPSRRTENGDLSLGVVTEQTTDINGQASQAGAESIITDTSENSTVKADTRKKGKSEQIAERHPTSAKRKKGDPGNPPGTKEAKLGIRQPSFASTAAFRQLVNNGKMVLFMPFLHYETHEERLKMSETIRKARKGGLLPQNASRDELLVHAYIDQLHPRRTLDQFLYHGIDTTHRDNDQVVWRYCDKHGFEPKKVFMVDQLWMWILGGDTVVTCFPQRWDQPKQDPLNVVDGIVEETNAKTRPPIQSVYDLALLITGRAAGMFDRHRFDEQQYQFLDMFESSIGNVTDKESQLFRKFHKASQRSTQWLERHRHGSDNDNIEHEFSDDLLNIHQETQLLAEIKDIQDELNILCNILDSQIIVLEDFQKGIVEELSLEGSRKTTDAVVKDIKRRFEEQQRMIWVHRNDIERMNNQAAGISHGLTNLLDLKQKHSNALEARFAREQAISAAKQGQTIMVFTIVTIVFLPMSFIASFFSINFADWGDGLTIGYGSKYMFGIGLAISFVFVAMAFLVHDISDAWKALIRGTRTYADCLSRKTQSLPSENATPPDAVSLRTLRTIKPGTAGAASTTAYRWAAEDMDWKRRGLEGPDGGYSRLSRDRDRYGHARFGGMSPLRYGGRKLSIGSGRGTPWARPSLDGRRGVSEDLERGRVL
ncbi:Ankyrin-3 [Cytospora mali]|uniref:Ankyrin-3 n=1 Tax=Cytospora mali TaxID=578113 RepID=A0A194VKD9_CYTMA|nr:Ankyrin-3 [Valsa mali]